MEKRTEAFENSGRRRKTGEIFFVYFPPLRPPPFQSFIVLIFYQKIGVIYEREFAEPSNDAFLSISGQGGGGGGGGGVGRASYRENAIMQLCQRPRTVRSFACQDPEKGAVGDGRRWRFLERLKIRSARDVLRNKMAVSE